MEVNFSEAEIAKVPPKLRGLMSEYPRTFDLLLDAHDKPRIPAPHTVIELYFDEELFPALSFEENQPIGASSATDSPVTITVLADDECAYVQVGDQVLLNRLSDDFLNIFEAV